MFSFILIRTLPTVVPSPVGQPGLVRVPARRGFVQEETRGCTTTQASTGHGAMASSSPHIGSDVYRSLIAAQRAEHASLVAELERIGAEAAGLEDRLRAHTAATEDGGADGSGAFEVADKDLARELKKARAALAAALESARSNAASSAAPGAQVTARSGDGNDGSVGSDAGDAGGEGGDGKDEENDPWRRMFALAAVIVVVFAMVLAHLVQRRANFPSVAAI